MNAASCTHQVHSCAFDFGKHLGVAFQLVDDALDFEASAANLGKPAMADMKLGIATAPVLFAQRQFPTLRKLAERKFEVGAASEQADGWIVLGACGASMLVQMHMVIPCCYE